MDTNNSMLLAEIERIKGQLVVFSEDKKISKEHLSNIHESIGEVRRSLQELQKQTALIDAKSSKAANIVEQVKPENTMIEIKKIEIKVTALTEKLATINAINEGIKSELSEVRKQITKFKSIDALIKEGKELQNQITALRKVEAEVKVDSNKIMNIYVEIQNHFSEFQKFKDIAQTLNKSYIELTKDIDKIKIRSAKVVSIEDFNQLKSNNEKKLQSILKLQDYIKRVAIYFKKITDSLMNERTKLMTEFMFLKEHKTDYIKFKTITETKFKEAIEQYKALSEDFSKKIKEIDVIKSEFMSVKKEYQKINPSNKK